MTETILQIEHDEISDLLKLIKPQQVCCYALANGWRRVPTKWPEIALFNSPTGELDQLIIPMDQSFHDYERRLEEVIENLAQAESRPAITVLHDLLTHEADIRIKHEYFSIIEDISRKLRPAQAPAPSLFVGYVENLGGEPDTSGQMPGEASLSVMFEEQMQPVRVDLSPADWRTAYAALGVHGFVRFKGVLHRGTRVHRITELSEFARVE